VCDAYAAGDEHGTAVVGLLAGERTVRAFDEHSGAERQRLQLVTVAADHAGGDPKSVRRCWS
jgi:hypothetical protein